MSVWLTPDLKPFYGGTYYPGKSDRASYTTTNHTPSDKADSCNCHPQPHRL